MEKRVTVSILAVVLAGLGSGCSETTGLAVVGFRQLGVLQFETTQFVTTTNADPDRSIHWTVPPGDGFAFPPLVIEAPDTVALGQTIEVTVNTIGINGCWRADGAEQSRSGRLIEITPYDLNSGAELCTTILTLLRHPVQLNPDQSGEWTLRANGRRVRGSSPDALVAAERTIFVK